MAETNHTGANIGFENKLWAAADKLRGHMDAADYKNVVLGLIFLKYISDSFQDRYDQLAAEQWADPEDRDEYLAANVFWVPKAARWSVLQDRAKQPEIGRIIDDAMIAIEQANPSLKGVLPKDYARPTLNKQRLGELIDLIASIGLGDRRSRSQDVLGRVYEYFLGQLPRPSQGAANSTPPNPSCASLSKCSNPTKAASMTPAADPAACSFSPNASSKPTAAANLTLASMARKATPPPGASAK